MLPAPEIVARIEKGEWTASEVLEAYIAREATSARLTNSVTEGELPFSGSANCKKLTPEPI